MLKGDTRSLSITEVKVLLPAFFCVIERVNQQKRVCNLVKNKPFFAKGVKSELVGFQKLIKR